MAEFINTADVIGDDEMCDQIIMRTVTEYKENRITKVGGRAFQRCTALTTVDVPNATSIGTYAFEGCSALTVVNIPNVTSINTYAFQLCTALKALVIGNSSVCQLINSNALSGSSIAKGTGYIYVPSALLADYQAATNWSTYSAQFRALEDYTVDGTITGALDESKI